MSSLGSRSSPQAINNHQRNASNVNVAASPRQSPRFGYTPLSSSPTGFATSALNDRFGSPRIGPLGSTSQASPSGRHRRLSSVAPTMQVSIANRDTLSRAAQLTAAVGNIRDIDYTDGQQLTIVDVTTDPVQALITLGKRLPSQPHEVPSQQSEYWVSLCKNEMNTDTLQRIDKQLAHCTYLIDPVLTVADIAAFAAVHTSILGFGVDDRTTYRHLLRWFNHIQSIQPIRDSNILSFVHNLTPPSTIYTINIGEKTNRAAIQAAKLVKVHKPDKTQVKSVQATTGAAAVGAAKAVIADKQESQPPATSTKPATKATPSKAAAAAPAEANPLIGRLEIKVGKVVEASKHPTEDRMLVSKVDVGESEPRTVVSGIAEHYKPEQLTGKHVLCITNVKPGDVKGVTSAGRLLVTTSADGQQKELVEASSDVKVGQRVQAEGIPDSKEPDLPHISSKHQHEVLKHFTTNEQRELRWKELPLTSGSAGVIKSPTIANGTVA